MYSLGTNPHIHTYMILKDSASVNVISHVAKNAVSTQKIVCLQILEFQE